MKRFSKKQLINKKNLAGVPTDKPGVYRIIDNKDEIQLVGKAVTGELSNEIEEHRGPFLKGTQFQYRTVSSYEEAEKLRWDEMVNTMPFRIKKR